MVSTTDILSAIEWLEHNDCPVESEPLLRVATMLQGIITQRTRARVRRQLLGLGVSRAAIKTATDKTMEALAEGGSS